MWKMEKEAHSATLKTVHRYRQLVEDLEKELNETKSEYKTFVALVSTIVAGNASHEAAGKAIDDLLWDDETKLPPAPAPLARVNTGDGLSQVLAQSAERPNSPSFAPNSHTFIGSSADVYE
jgi:hypothetical protein